jgi:hypothetical protein
VATAATVTAIGPAKLFVLFVTERRAAIAPVTGGNVYGSFVDEFHGVLKTKGPHAAGLCAATP